MGNEMLWAAVHADRTALARDLDSLSDQQWSAPTACPGWDVHDVLAHLVDSAKTTRIGFVLDMLACRFDFDKANERGIRRERRADPRETLAILSGVINRTTTPPAPLATRLVEAFVHGEDIRRAIGLHGSYPAEHVATALRYQVRTSFAWGGGRERCERLRLVASDSDFVVGDGSQVCGTSIALLLAVSGRPVKDGELTGDGAGALMEARR